MKTIGLIGGTSWVSSAEYYRIINEEANRRLGGLNSARCILYSINLAEFDERINRGKKQDASYLFINAAKNLENSGADCILLCSNTTHVYADQIENSVNIPLIHIAETTANVIKNKQISVVGLLGTKITMEQKYYRDKIGKAEIKVVIPNNEDRTFLHYTIFDELSKGVFTSKAKKQILKIINKLERQGARGIILGCTELPLLIKPEDVNCSLFDTAFIHSMAEVDFALGGINIKLQK